jgi:gluconokinase
MIEAAKSTARNHAAMPASLLDSRLATPEPPGPDENPTTVYIARPVSEIVKSTFGVLYLGYESRSDFDQF